MVFIPALNVAMVSWRYTQSGQQTENRTFFLRDGTISPTNLAELAEACSDWWVANLRDWSGVHLTLREVYAVDLTTVSSPSATHVETPAPVGVFPGTPLPNNVTLAVSFRTPGRGRSSRGRWFVTGLTETSLSSTLGQTVNIVYAAGILDAFVALNAALPAGWTHVVVSFYSGGAARSEGVVIPITNYLLTDLTIDSQRRRLPGRGA